MLVMADPCQAALREQLRPVTSEQITPSSIGS